MAGYAVEALLKCAICKRLQRDRLPRVFYFHDLDVLMYFSGLRDDLEKDKIIYRCFQQVANIWNEGLRYEDPAQSNITEKTCAQFDLWLNDRQKGIVPWLAGHSR